VKNRLALTVAALATAATLWSYAQEATEAYLQYQLGETRFAEGRYADAMRAYEAASRATDAALARPAAKGHVRAALRTAEFDLAHRSAQKLVEQDAEDPEALTLLGDARWAMGLFDEADTEYARALARNPDSARARFGLARSLATRSRLTDALDETLTTIRREPRDADVQALAALIYERLLQFEEAAARYSAYADLLPPAEATAIATSRARAEFLRSFAGRAPVSISAEQSSGVHTLPFKLVRNKVVVQGRLNGQPVEWVLDTGAERTGVSFDLASRARVRAVTTTLTAGVGRASFRRVRLGRADRLEIGKLQLRNVPVAIRNPALNGAPRWQGESLSPIALGLSVVVDYGRRQVTFARALPHQQDGITLPMRLHRLPLVRGMLNSTYPASFVVDTGGEVISISAETASALNMQASRRIPLRVFGLSGLDESAFLLPGVDLDFEEIEYRKVGLAVLDLRAPSVLLGFQVGGIVGHKLLGEYRVAFDVGRSELRLVK
jgi:cytochrome c-type biogenesis protein CcmH/NrfG